MYNYPAYYFVRHAESLHNQRATLVKTKYNLPQNADISQNKEYQEVKFGQDYFDCSITTPGGFQECQKSKKLCENLDIGLVLVSPLYRALITCHQTFKDHKNKPKVIVDPLFGERMTSACDLGAKLRKSMIQFPDYDFTSLTKLGIEDTWYIQNLPIDRRERLYAEIKQAGAVTAHQIAKVVLLQLRQKGHLESVKEVQLRIQRLKLRILQYSKQTQKRIAIVGHNNMIKTLTATGFKQDGTPVNGVSMGNCQVQQINIVIEGSVNK